MSRSLNKVMLIGYTADEPAIRVLSNGSKLAQVTVVTNEALKRSDGKLEEEPEWNRVVFWGQMADIVDKYVHKGMRLYVEGKLKTRSYLDQNGNKCYLTEINGDNLIMLDSKSDPGSRAAPPFNRTNAFNQKPTFNQKAAFNPASALKPAPAPNPAPDWGADDEAPF